MNRREFLKAAGLAIAFPCGIASICPPETEYLGRKILYGNATDKPLEWSLTFHARILNDDFVHVLTLPEDLTKEEQRQIEDRIDEYNKELEAA